MPVSTGGQTARLIPGNKDQRGNQRRAEDNRPKAQPNKQNKQTYPIVALRCPFLNGLKQPSHA